MKALTESAHHCHAQVPVCRSGPRSRGWLFQVTARDRRAKGCVDPSSRREELEVPAPYAATVRARKPRPNEPELPSVPGLESRSIPSASQSASWRQRGPLHFESQSTSFSSHCLRIDAVVFFMRSEKSDHQNASYVLNQGNQPKIVGLDIKNHTTALQDARLRVRFLHLFRHLPVCFFRDRQPGVVLRSRSLDSSVAGP